MKFLVTETKQGAPFVVPLYISYCLCTCMLLVAFVFNFFGQTQLSWKNVLLVLVVVILLLLLYN